MNIIGHYYNYVDLLYDMRKEGRAAFLRRMEDQTLAKVTIEREFIPFEQIQLGSNISMSALRKWRSKVGVQPLYRKDKNQIVSGLTYNELVRLMKGIADYELEENNRQIRAMQKKARDYLKYVLNS